MDETDFSWSGKKKQKKPKEDKADAVALPGETSNYNYGPPDGEKKPIVSIHTDDDTYESCEKTGIALIFNHKDVKGQKSRTGTEKDRDDIARSLGLYGFEVRIFNDLTFEELNEKLKEAANEDHSNNDCFVLVVMSHGTEGRVYAKDMSYPSERLWDPFLGDKCKTLINKPKIFFIQACRGTKLDQPVTYTDFQVMSRFSSERTIVYAIPSTADMVVMYSTFDKHFSFRNVELGSWFIQSLCAALNEGAAKQDIEQGCELYSLLTAVNRKVAYGYQSNVKYENLNDKKEMPNFMSTLTKTFYLRMKSFK